MQPTLSDPADLDRRHVGIVALVCGAGFLVVAALVVTTSTNAVDTWWAAVTTRARAPVAVWVSQALTVVGDAPATTALRVAGGIWLLLRRRYTAFWAWTIAAVAAPLIVQLVKELVGRARPLDYVWTAGGASFPSGHAAAAAANAALVVLLLVPRRHRRLAAVLGAVWTAAMAAARNVLGAHWLADVAGGILLGLSVTCGVVAVVLSIGDRRRQRSHGEEADEWDARSQSRG
ncbi:MAG: phosphatase PAP2 family protein [Acidimicrobiia bacterium]|nr:phosphatase PAP2 family protein [Acidimicrobiia bacterium]